MRRRFVAADDAVDRLTNRKRGSLLLGYAFDAAFSGVAKGAQLVSGHMTCLRQVGRGFRGWEV